MSSENIKYQDDGPEQYGRTGWDILYTGRRVLLIISIVIAILVSIYLAAINGLITGEMVVGAIRDNWPSLVSPIIGAMMGYYSIKRLMIPQSRILLMTDMEHGIVRVVRVPEQRFRMMTQAGNTFMLHSLYGQPVYLVRNIDEHHNHIDYGWIHEERAEVVAVNLDAYNKWRDDLTKTKVENLQLLANPQVMAADLSRKNLRSHLDRLCKALGLSSVPDMGDPLDNEFENPEEKQIEDPQDVQQTQQPTKQTTQQTTQQQMIEQNPEGYR